MFSHVSVLLSFVYALAVTHLLTSATELMWARNRVRVSWLQVLWMFTALVILFQNWIGMWFLSLRTQWDVAEITIYFVGAIVQYFTCSLISIRPTDGEPIDMKAFFQHQRPLIFTAFFILATISMFENWWDRALFPNPDGWLYANLTIFPVLALFGIAGFARAMWLQWIAGIATSAIAVYFLIAFAL